jgi:signal transduction histidine kinase
MRAFAVIPAIDTYYQFSGVNPGIVDKIFQPFYTTKSKGTGLGLAITKRLIEQHGGTIRAENNRDCGVTFLATLPVKQQEASAL